MWPFQSDNTKQLKKLKKLADKVVALEPKYQSMSGEELTACTAVLKDRLAKGETLNDILPDAFALVRETAWRVIGKKPFYVQILGGIALHQGRVAEMKTGEGKTLVATMPAYLNALSGKGVHIVTVNDYLVRCGAEEMGKVYKFLGLTVGISVPNMTEQQKRDSYNSDITYCTNNELGFDYLRDNMVQDKKQRVGRGYNFAIVDEVDSILIDEARTPLIISGRGMKSSENYYSADRFAKSLKDVDDYEIEPKHKTVHLSEEGVAKAEKFFKVENLSDESCIELNHHIMNALKANYIMKLDENYIVKDDQVLIVDEFTGRLMEGRRYSEGLHQAIEAKENVKIKDEDKTLATITFQNYFRKYTKLSGMTGTAKTEESEFNGIYKLDVVCIPPNLPNARTDFHDIVFCNAEGKKQAILEEIKTRHAEGQPILVGTSSIEKSEEISSLLNKAGIRHNVLNAKNHERESEIVAQAGRLKAVTIATNMAGRGTDILLGGNPEFLAKHKMKEKNFTPEEISFAVSLLTSDDPKLIKAKETYNKFYEEFKVITDAEKLDVIKAGGLHIIGTERHESRRIDNQLRGRSGRQGDVGSSVFYVSLEDDLVKRFGGERLQKIAMFFKLDNEPIQLRMMSKGIERAQKAIEAQNYGIRRTVLQFDDVMNNQREIIYGERNKVLDGLDVHEQIMEMFPDVISKICNTYLDADKPYFEWDLSAINNGLEDRMFPKNTNLITEEFVEDCDIPDVVNKILRIVDEKYKANVSRLKEVNFDFSNIERHMLLRVVDINWMNHIDQMHILRQEIGLRGYGQKDPVVEYKREGFDMFDKMIETIRTDTSAMLLNVNINIEKMPTNRPAQQTNNTIEGKASPVSSKVPETPKERKIQKTVISQPKPNRNEACPCGSGKKYKNCCALKE